ncbi:protease [Lithospermum erythrorhizon]|uniref:Protease n=1 Tax=Lithospermum erythrorhizon TaxID=34254 RepID=A0AAV3NZQ1_LITER
MHKMASMHTPLLSFLFFLLLISSSTIAQTSFRPRALILAVTKDSATGQYITEFSQRTPLVPLKLTVNLGGDYLWVDCFKNYISSTYRPAICRSAVCNLAKSTSCVLDCGGPTPGCNNNTCALLPFNPYIRTSSIGEVADDVVSMQSTDGTNPGQLVSAKQVLFVCGGETLLEGLVGGVTGIVGLGKSPIGFPSQLAKAFSFPRKFAICLSSSSSSKGVIFFGESPYNFLPGQDVSQLLTYTPLLHNPVSTGGAYTTGEQSVEYFIGVKSIKVNNQIVPVNTTLFKIDKEANGGTKISSVDRYTLLETSVYDAVTNAFVNSISKVPRVNPVAPFKYCYKSASFGSTRLGPGVPPIELVLQTNGASWTIFGANSMVPVNGDVLCLGFLDAGLNPRTTIIIGAHQIEDNLIQFDIERSRIGFSSTLLGRQTNCGNFNFTSVA